MESKRLLVLAVFAAALLGVSGCGGTTRTVNETFPAASDWFEGAPGSIAVLPGDDRPFFSFSSLDDRTDGSASASTNVAANTAGSGCGADPVSSCNNDALDAPAGAFVEPVIEAENKESWSVFGTASLKQASEHLKHSLADRRPQLLVSHAVVSRIQARTDYDAQLRSFRGHPEEFLPDGPFNGVVEVGLTKFGLVFDGPFDETAEDPRVALEIGVSAKVYSMREQEFVRLASGGWVYLGTARRLSKLTAENGRLLNEELERAATSLARRIVD